MFLVGLDTYQESTTTPSKKSLLSSSTSTDMLSPTALESKLIASYDVGSDGSLLPTLSPFSQTSRLGYASPSRDGGAFSRSLLSPPRSAGKAPYGGSNSSSSSSGGGRAWPSSSPHRPATLGGHAGSNDSLGSVAGLSHSPLSPLPTGIGGGGGLGMLHLRGRVWPSPARGGGRGRRDKTGIRCGAQQAGAGEGGGVPTPSKSPRSRDWKTAVTDSEQRFFAAAAVARDAATAVTPGEVREMAKRSGRVDGGQHPPSSPGDGGGDPFESWGHERAGSWGGGGVGGDSRNGTPATINSNDVDSDRQRQSSRGGRSSWSRGNDNSNDKERDGHSATLTPPGGVEEQGQDQGQDQDHAPKFLETPRAPTHATPSPAASRGVASTDAETDADADADDTLLAAASLVSFQKPRAAEAPRLKGPLGTSALRVTLGTPVVTTGVPSISSSVQAKLSLPRTAPTPTTSFSSSAAELRGGGGGSGIQTPADPMETAYRAAGLSVGSGGGGAGSGRSQGPGAAAKAAESEASLVKSVRNGMFDAVSPTAPVEESGTPYSVCRVDRNGRPNSTPAPASAEQKKGHGGGGGEPLCHTPLKPATSGRESGAAAASGSAEARPAGWSGSGAGPWATPPPMPMGTPCSGSRFRSADDEESDYSDYETVRVKKERGAFVCVLLSSLFLFLGGW